MPEKPSRIARIGRPLAGAGIFLGPSLAVLGLAEMSMSWINTGVSAGAWIGMGIFVFVASGYGVIWFVQQENARLRKRVLTREKSAELRRKAANHYENLAALDGDFDRGFTGSATSETRELLHDRIVDAIRRAHTDIVAIDSPSADHFIDGRNIDDIPVDQRELKRLLITKLRRLNEIREGDI